MTLLALIRKGEPATLANANPAKVANDGRAAGGTLARLATLALANPTIEKPAHPAVIGAGDSSIASHRWLIHFIDRDPLELAYYPAATHTEILERHPDAEAAEPFKAPVRRPAAPMTAKEELTIRAWLALIEETDPETIAEVMGQCQQDADARDFFIGIGGGCPLVIWPRAGGG